MKEREGATCRKWGLHKFLAPGKGGGAYCRGQLNRGFTVNNFNNYSTCNKTAFNLL